MSERTTRVRLLNVPLERDYKQTIYFADIPSQKKYFESDELLNYEIPEFNYIRKDSKIRVAQPIDNLKFYNYLFYDNCYSNGKKEQRKYCFITKMEYVDDNRTDIFIETDVMQSYLENGDYYIKPSFIEREHVDNDEIGTHTIPEQIEHGEYIAIDRQKNIDTGDYCLIMAVTVDLNGEGFPSDTGGIYNGIFSGVKYYYMTSSKATQCIKALASAGKSDAIVSIFYAPVWLIDGAYDNSKTYYEIETNGEAYKREWQVTFVNDNVDGYTPLNNKLLTYPYKYLLLTNNCGSSTTFNFENFKNFVYKFYIFSTLTVGCSTVLIPSGYEREGLNTLHTLVMGKLPVCSWNTDVYTNWLTQNSINIGTSLASSGLQVVGGVGAMLGGLFTGGLTSLAGAGSLASGFMGIANSVGEIYSHSLQPPVLEGNINCGDAMFSSDNISFDAYHMSIKEEYAKIIDNYFQMYGYKVNRVGIPLKNHREKWWFTKTININIDSTLVYVEDLQKIKDIYNNGILFVRPEYARNIDFTSINNIKG